MTLEEVRSRAEHFRSDHRPHLDADQIPIDLLTFADLELQLDLIPFDGLSMRFSAEAALLADFSGIYVDSEVFDRLESSPNWKINRLRFSLAHELGHWVLHRERFDSEAFTSHDHLREWLSNHGGDKYQIEKEANEFAGRLLVPIDILQPLFDELANGMDKLRGRHAWWNDDQLRLKACEQIAPRFGVNQQVIAVRLDRESLWPSVY